MSKNNNNLTIYIILTAVTFLAFSQVTGYDFINFDDPLYVNQNMPIHNGITTEAIRWAFTTGHAGNWHPLTWVSHMLDVQLFGLNPHMHHMTNLLFHVANVLLLFFIFFRMTKAPWKSAFVAALFAIHPLHVESVAWVSERKDVLSTFFWMLTMIAYIHYVERPRLWTYLPVLAFFALGLMAKPMLVTLPFVLLLLDYWPLQRFERKDKFKEIRTEANKRVGSGQQTVSSFPRTTIRTLLLEKVPLIALAAISSIVTMRVQQGGLLVVSSENLPMSDRIANAFVAYFTYIVNAIWPENLAFYYPYQWWESWQVMGALLFFIAVTFIVIWAAKRSRYLTVGWLWYVGTLVPVIGLIQVGSQARADRYTYIPLIGIFVMAAWGIPELLQRKPYRNKILLGVSALVLLCFFTVTRIQVGYWRNSLTLFDRTLKVTVKNYIAYKHRGDAYATLGYYKQAIADYDRAIAIVPGYYGLAYFGRGKANFELGNDKDAISDYDSAEKIMPKYAAIYYHRGTAYADLRLYRNAIEDYDKAIQLHPSADMYGHRGWVYAALGKYEQAIADYDRTIQIQPRSAQAYGDRGIVYAALGNHRRAIEDYNRAIDLKPGFAAAYYGRAFSYNNLGDKELTVRDLKAAAGLGNTDAQNALRGLGIN